MAASGNQLLGEVLLRLPAQPVRVTIELGDAFSTPADVLVLKYAQGSYGVDLEALRRLGDANGSITMPRAGERIAVLAGSAASAHAVVFIGTPPVQRLDYSAVQAWAKSAVAPASPVTLLGEKSGVLTEPTSIVTTVHGVENLDRKLDEAQTLRAQLNGFLSGLRSRTAKPKLERIRIVELDEARAERLAEALSKIATENSGFEPVHLARYSADVHRLASTFDPGVQVTASALAQEFQAAHPDYAGGMFTTTSLDLEVGLRRTVNLWLERVRDLYTVEASTTSKPVVIDGRMVLAGLVKLDRPFRRTLDEAGVAEHLWAELKVRPSDPDLREDIVWKPDAPAIDDHLDRRLVATALGERLAECDARYPGESFLAHIDGPWGAGKSTLLTFLLDHNGERDRPWCVVEFDAWRQARAGPPWLLLLTALRSALLRDGYLSRWSLLHERWQLLGLRYQLAGLACVTTLAVLIGLLASGLTNFDTASSAALGTVTLVGALWAASKTIGRILVLDSRRGATMFVETRRDPMEELARHFQWLRRKSPVPLLLVVDDLDRCDYEYVVEFLDSTQKLLRDEPANAAEGTPPPSLFVVVAADGRWLGQAYELSHSAFAEAVGEPGRPLGSLFLDKLFQLRVPVPQLSPSRQETFLRSLLRPEDDDDMSTPGDVELQAQIQDAETSDQVLDVLAAAPTEQRIRAAATARERLTSHRESEHALTNFAPLLEPNPRSVLRFTMAFDILRAARLTEGSPVPANRLALWAIITTRWPALADFLQRNPDAVELFLSRGDALADGVPTDLHQLFANPGPEVRNVFNHPEGGPVTGAVIRECAGVA
jgi:hypothetical protein